MSDSAAQVWQKYVNSMKNGTDQWHELLANDVEFIGPVMQTKGKDQFIKMNNDFSRMIRGFVIHKQAAGDNTVATECTITVATPSEKNIDLKLAEIYDVKNGKIQSVNIYYDPREFVQAFGM